MIVDSNLPKPRTISLENVLYVKGQDIHMYI